MSRVVRFHEYGEPEVLKIEDISVPSPEPDEVQIAVRAIGLNRAESMFRRNAYLRQAVFPTRLGYKASGTVKAVGSEVHYFKVGDIVSVIPTTDMTRWGTYAELTNIPARNVVKHPQHLSFEEAAASWMQYLTAWGALIDHAKLTSGDFVIVTAASSSVGIAAFQVAKVVGATVIATTRTSAKRDALLKAGADHVIATAEEDVVAKVMEITAGKGARVVFDPVGGPMIELLAGAMAQRGILLEYGALSSEPGTFPQFALLRKGLTFKGYLYIEVVLEDDVLERAKQFIVDGLANGKLKPLISRTFPFERIQEATRFLESNEQIGKVVVTI
jgi:NADPH:quinone reductase-like Zn-dependent oxidoreductase